MRKQTATQILGITLLETLLVLAIMSAIFIFSMNQYQMLNRESEARIVQSNVDILFDAAVKYFRAHCGDVNSPLHGYYNNKYYPVSISTLISEKALTVPNDKLQVSPFVDLTKGDQGYYVQFNQVHDSSSTTQLPTRNSAGPHAIWFGKAPIALSFGDGPYDLGSLVIWRIQVSAALKGTAAQARTTTQFLGANCATTASGNTVIPCGTGTGSGTYAVWERLPSQGSPSPDWIMKPTLNQFKQMYTTWPILPLINGTINDQYFYCGGQ